MSIQADSHVYFEGTGRPMQPPMRGGARPQTFPTPAPPVRRVVSGPVPAQQGFPPQNQPRIAPMSMNQHQSMPGQIRMIRQQQQIEKENMNFIYPGGQPESYEQYTSAFQQPSPDHPPPSQQPVRPASQPASQTPRIQPAPPPIARNPSRQEQQPPQPAPSEPMQRPMQPRVPPLGLGQGVVRMLQFSAALSRETPARLELGHWQKVISEYFTPKARIKFTVWRDNQRVEAKPFDIGMPILPRFFLVNAQSGVKSQSLSIDGCRERLMAPHMAIIESPCTYWTYRYTNGYTVVLVGPLTAHIVVTPSPNTPNSQFSLKIDHLQFDADRHEKMISFDTLVKSPKPESPIFDGIKPDDAKREPIHLGEVVLPPEPVNGFGISQATMRCLELAESVVQMSDLIQFESSSQTPSNNRIGPIAALRFMTGQIRDNNPGLVANLNSTNHGPPSSLLYSGAAGPSHLSAPSPKLSPSDPGSPKKHAKNTPSMSSRKVNTPQQPPPTPQSASTPTPATPATPAMTSASLKRKSGQEAAEPATKRTTRKRGRTNG